MIVDRPVSEAEIRAVEQIADVLLRFRQDWHLETDALFELAGELAEIARQCADIAYSEASSAVQIVVLTPDVIQ